MNKYMILFAVGKDRPGIVEEVSSYLLNKNANIEDSRMASLGGRFSIMCLFSCSDSELTDLKKNIGVMSGLGIEVSFHEAENPAEVTNRAGMPLNFELRSMDHPGIVQKVVRLLKSYNINIHSLDTQVKSMPHSGAPLFDLYLKADVPEEVVIGKVKEALSELALEMNLDLTYL